MLSEHSIERRFLAFHARNPHVYERLVALVREARANGATKLGIKQVWEVMRWQMHDFQTEDSSSERRLNNNYHSRYARLIEQQNPEFRGIFETRMLRTPSELFAEVDDAQITLFEDRFGSS